MFSCSIYSLGLVLITVAARALAGQSRSIGLGVGTAALVLATVLAATRAVRAKGHYRRGLTALLRSLLTTSCGVALWALFASERLPNLGEAGVLVDVVWPVVVAWGLLPAIAIEWALHHAGDADTVEPERVLQAERAGRIMVFGLTAFAGLNYVAERDHRKIDLSYFRTTQVGEATLHIAQGVTQPVHLVLFFPPGNDVAEAVRSYAQELSRSCSGLIVEQLDHALAPERARQLKVRHNGTVVLTCGDNVESLAIPLDIEDARGVLRRLDAEVQRRLIQVIRPPRLLYVTSGHMERDISPAAADTRAGLADFKSLAEGQGYLVRRLGLAEGLGTDVPQDAAVVAILGPTEPFSAAERGAVARFVGRGGRLLVAIDPRDGASDDLLLAPFGVQVGRSLVANSHYNVRVEGQAQSPYNLVTTRTSGHPSVRTLEQNPGRMGLVLLGAGAVSKRADAPAGLRQSTTVWSMPQSWEDIRANGKIDAPQEKEASLSLAMAIESTAEPKAASHAQAQPAMRALVVGDVDFVTRGIVRNPGNTSFVLDGLRWLVNDEAEAGAAVTEEDIPLIHRQQDDAVWFYGTTFGVPVAVLLLGLKLGPRRQRLPQQTTSKEQP